MSQTGTTFPCLAFFHARIQEEKMVIREFQYTPEDVDCRYCTKFIHNRCRAVKCPWMNERIEAGVVSYQTAVDESFMDHAILRLRVKIVLGFYDKSFWKDEDHFRRFQIAQAVLGYSRRRNTNAYYAALFLLTSDEDLLRRALDCFSQKSIRFELAKLRDISPKNYALYKVAKSLYTDSAEVGVDEIADPELVDTESFHLVINAMLIYRYGLSALLLKSEDGEHGTV